MDVTLVFLAGGGGARINHLAALLPKSALLVYDESILTRNLRQALDKGFKRVLISTRSPYLEPLSELVCAAKMSARGVSLKVVANKHHERGPLPALLHVLGMLDTPRVALSLPDIFFFDNPYGALCERCRSGDNCLGVADPFDEKELSKSCVVICDRERIHAVVEAPAEGCARGVRWSGLAAFDRDLGPELEAFISGGREDSRIGDFFEHLRAAGNALRPFWVSDFININTRDDLFLAAMYRAVELHGADSETGRTLAAAARSLRTRLL